MWINWYSGSCFIFIGRFIEHFYLNVKVFMKNFGSREESEVAGFFIYTDDGLFKVRVNECPAGLGNKPRRIRAPPQGLEIGGKLL